MHPRNQSLMRGGQIAGAIMIRNAEIRLARLGDALRIAEMSRDFVETGLGWGWTRSRVASAIKAKDSNVIVTVKENRIIGFAIMKYLDSEARLYLFAVHPGHRRQRVGTRMIQWLEKTASTNGSGVVYLETRTTSKGAQAFYKNLGYKVIQRVPGYYGGRETALRMAHDLWSPVPSE